MNTLIDRLNQYLATFASLLVFLMVLLMAATVLQRYVFGVNHIWQHELVMFLHAAIFMGAAAYGLQCKRHVCVDVFSERYTRKQKALVNLLGTGFFLIPFCVVLLYVSSDSILNSWAILEGSRESDGLHAVYLLKTLIWVYAGTLLLQAVSWFMKSCNILRDD